MPKGNLLFKERDVARAIRGFEKGGKVVDRVLIDRDGNIAVLAKSTELGSSSNSPLSDNEWDDLLNAKPAA